MLSVDNVLPRAKGVHFQSLHDKQAPFAQEELRRDQSASGGARNAGEEFHVNRPPMTHSEKCLDLVLISNTIICTVHVWNWDEKFHIYKS